MRRELPVRECHVWWARPSRLPAHLEQLLDDRERARCAGFGRYEDRLRFVTGRVLARTALAHYVNFDPTDVRLTACCCSCGSTSHGKPAVSEPAADLELSLSHSGDAVAVAVTSGVAVGVDVQEITPQALTPAVARRMLCDPELETVDRVPEPARTLRILQYLTRKEALLKATGEGLAVPFAHVDVTRAPAVQVADLRAADGYVASAALMTAKPYAIIERNGESLLAGH
jgi:4'-phosphopantetheinyl transferase